MTATQTASKKIVHISSIGLSLIMTLLLLTELYLTQSGKSLCSTAACEIVAKYVRFGEPLLLAAGACFFLVLAATLFFAKRHPANRWLTTLPLVVIVGAASFDGALIGFQYVTLGQKCLICLIVASAIGFISILYAATYKKWSIALLCITAWVAGFAANATLIMPDITSAGSGMVFYERPAAKETNKETRATFIFSMECSHCMEVLEYLAKENPKESTWRFAIVDADKKIINKLGSFYEKAAQTDNPFQLLIQAKKEKGTLAPNILAKFPELTRQARIFLSTNRITGVPLLVVDEGKETTTFYKGSNAILDYLQEEQ